LNHNEKFIWTIKKDWYGQDRIFLQENRDSIFFTMFSKINEFPNDYFDFYPANAFIRQVKYITNWYMDEFEKENPDREFPFLSKKEMDDFVNDTIGLLQGLF